MAKARASNRITSPYEHWEDLSDARFFAAMEDFRTFCAESLVNDKNGIPRPFILNEAQELFASTVLKAMQPIIDKLPTPSIRVLVHKSRQMGITTVCLKLEQFVLSKATNFNALHVMPTEGESDEMIDRKLLPLMQGTHPDIMADMSASGNKVDFHEFEGVLLDNRLTFMSSLTKGAGHGRLTFNDEYVITYNKGEITWGEVEVGDILFDRNGDRTTVTEKFHHYNKQRFRVYLKDGRYLDAGDEHLWLVANQKLETHKKEQTAFTAETQWLLANGADKYSIPNPGQIELQEQELLIDPYSMGVFLGDGYILKDGTVCVKTKYKPHADLIGDSNWDGKEERWNKSSIKYRDAFMKYGLNGKVASDKYIPRVYLLNSVENRKKLLAGLLDTDGCARSKTRFNTISEQLAKDVQWLVRSLGGYSQISLQTKVRRNEQPYYTVSVAVDFNPFTRPEKAARYNPVKVPKWTRIDRIEPLHEYADATCVTVDAPSHTYIAGRDFVVTHNTVHMLVEDEHAKYQDPFSLEAGILPAMSGNTIRIVLFTAKGMNHSYDLSKVAQDPESAWIYLFLPWYILAEYEKEPTGKYKDLTSLSDYDLFLASEFEKAGIPVEQWARKMQWYDYTFINEAKRDQMYMYENYPTVAQESFQASGAPIFDSRLLYEWMETPYNTIDVFYNEGQTEFRYVEGGAIKELKAPIKGHQYMIGIDPADGEVDGDDSALAVIDYTNPKLEVVASYNGTISQNDLAEMTYDLAMRYNQALLVPERNMGQLMIKWLTEIKGYMNIWTDAAKVSDYNNLGVRTTVPSKNEMVARLKFLMNNGYFVDFDPTFCEQGLYFTFQKTQGGQFRAAGDAGHHDDTILARMLCTMALDMSNYKAYAESIKKEGKKY